MKLTSLGVEADEAAAVAVVDGHAEFLLLEHALPSLPEACKQSILGILLFLLERSLELLARLLRYVFVFDVDRSRIYLGINLFTGHCAR